MESFFGIGGPELLLILILATIILGPLNMIKMARQFGILMRDLRNYYQSLTANLSQELGDLAELENTLRGEVNAALPKPEELQVTVPNLMAEAQQVLDTPPPNQPAVDAVESSEPASPEAAATTPAQLEAGPGGPGTVEPAEPQSVQVVPTENEPGSPPPEPEQAQPATALTESSETNS